MNSQSNFNKNQANLRKFFSPNTNNSKNPYNMYEQINPYATVRDKKKFQVTRRENSVSQELLKRKTKLGNSFAKKNTENSILRKISYEQSQNFVKQKQQKIQSKKPKKLKKEKSKAKFESRKINSKKIQNYINTPYKYQQHQKSSTWNNLDLIKPKKELQKINQVKKKVKKKKVVNKSKKQQLQINDFYKSSSSSQSKCIIDSRTDKESVDNFLQVKDRRKQIYQSGQLDDADSIMSKVTEKIIEENNKRKLSQSQIQATKKRLLRSMSKLAQPKVQKRFLSRKASQMVNSNSLKNIYDIQIRNSAHVNDRSKLIQQYETLSQNMNNFTNLLEHNYANVQVQHQQNIIKIIQLRKNLEGLLQKKENELIQEEDIQQQTLIVVDIQIKLKDYENLLSQINERIQYNYKMVELNKKKEQLTKNMKNFENQIDDLKQTKQFFDNNKNRKFSELELIEKDTQKLQKKIDQYIQNCKNQNKYLLDKILSNEQINESLQIFIEELIQNDCESLKDELQSENQMTILYKSQSVYQQQFQQNESKKYEQFIYKIQQYQKIITSNDQLKTFENDLNIFVTMIQDQLEHYYEKYQQLKKYNKEYENIYLEIDKIENDKKELEIEQQNLTQKIENIQNQIDDINGEKMELKFPLSQEEKEQVDIKQYLNTLQTDYDHNLLSNKEILEFQLANIKSQIQMKKNQIIKMKKLKNVQKTQMIQIQTNLTSQVYDLLKEIEAEKNEFTFIENFSSISNEQKCKNSNPIFSQLLQNLSINQNLEQFCENCQKLIFYIKKYITKEYQKQKNESQSFCQQNRQSNSSLKHTFQTHKKKMIHKENKDLQFLEQLFQKYKYSGELYVSNVWQKMLTGIDVKVTDNPKDSNRQEEAKIFYSEQTDCYYLKNLKSGELKQISKQQLKALKFLKEQRKQLLSQNFKQEADLKRNYLIKFKTKNKNVYVKIETLSLLFLIYSTQQDLLDHFNKMIFQINFNLLFQNFLQIFSHFFNIIYHKKSTLCLISE